MRMRGLDINGDWLYGKGQNDYVTQNAAAALLIRTRLLSFLGDCFFDTLAGIPWFLYLGAKDQTSLNLAVSAVILNTPDENGTLIVTGIKQLSVVLNHETRNLTIKYDLITIYSTVTSSFSYDLSAAP